MISSTCEKCGQVKIKYRAYACKSCRVSYLEKWQKSNRDYVNSKSREWVENNKEKRKSTLKKSRIKNRDKILEYKKAFYQKNKDKYRVYSKNENPDVRRGIKRRYRARLSGVGSVKYKASSIFKRDNNLCVYCGDTAKELDHVIPVSRGGGDFPDNVVASCVPCNRRKHAKTSEEFMKPVFDKIRLQLEYFTL